MSKKGKEMEKIEIRANTVGGDFGPSRHLYIIYTNKFGEEFYIRGGPQNSTAFEFFSNGGFGQVVTEHGRYMDGTPDWNAPENDPDPSIIVATGEDLSEQYRIMTETADVIEQSGATYELFTQNSNSVVFESVERAGVTPKFPPEVDGRDKFGGAPGANTDVLDDDIQNHEENLENNPECFPAGTPIEMAGGTVKPIETLALGDTVLAFDPDLDSGQGEKVARRVTQLHVNHDRALLDFHGLRVTPGHVFLTGDGTFKPVLEILEEDGTAVLSDGTVVRARTGAAVGSKEDRAIPVGYQDGSDPDGGIKTAMMRAGTPYGVKHGRTYTIEQMMRSRGYHLAADGRFVNVEGDVKTAYWEWGQPDAKLKAGQRASYADLFEDAGLPAGAMVDLPLVPSRPN